MAIVRLNPMNLIRLNASRGDLAVYQYAERTATVEQIKDFKEYLLACAPHVKPGDSINIKHFDINNAVDFVMTIEIVAIDIPNQFVSAYCSHLKYFETKSNKAKTKSEEANPPE